MSVSLERKRRSSIMPPYFEGAFAGEQRFPAAERREEGEDEEGSSSSSAIGRNSDVSGDKEESGEELEVQSACKGPLDTMHALEEVLPVKKGISMFYNGKSKSFTSLADASSASSIRDFAKPENPYTKKRKNLLASSYYCSCPPRDAKNGISKRPANSNRGTQGLGLTVSYSKSNNNSVDCHPISLSPYCFPPLPSHGKRLPGNETWSPPPLQNSPRRSFSLSDLQCAAAASNI